MDASGSAARTSETTLFRFGDVVVDPAAHVLLRAGVAQPVEPKAFAVLLVLLQHAGELVPRDALLDAVWGHRHVTPGVLTRVIAQLRHALQDTPQQPRYIETRHALGYSFVGVLEVAEAPVEPMPAPESPGAVEVTPPVVDAIAPVPPAASPSPVPTLRATTAASRWYRRGLVVAVLAALAWAALAWWPRPAARPPASVAVLPFVNLGGPATGDYFAEGLAEELRNALAGVPGLKVVAAVPAGARPDTTDVRALGRQLGVRAVLGASVRREGQRVRITARLTDTGTGFTLWSHTYDRKLAGIFDTQGHIAAEVVHALLGSVPVDGAALTKRLAPTRSEAAFDSYLQGLQLLRHAVQPAAVDQAIARFDLALQQDSRFARAQAAICRAELWQFQSLHSPAAVGRAKDACQRAKQMDPSLAETDVALGDLYRVTGDPNRALQHYRKAAQDPLLAANAHVNIGKIYAALERSAQALAEFQQALQLDPGSASVHAELGYQQYLDGKLTQAVASYRRAVELRPDSAELWGALGAIYLEAGDAAAAESALEHAIAIAPAVDTLSNLGQLRYLHGDHAAAVALQRRAVALDPEDFRVWANLAGALRADPASNADEARQAFKEAATRAEAYLKLKPDDADATASLGLYRANLGDVAVARKLVRQAEALHGKPGDIALLNAETLALVGDLPAARQRLLVARTAGTPDMLIAGNDTFRRLGLWSPPSAAGKPAGAEPRAPQTTAVPSTGG